jgi:pseudouridine kinase
MERLPQDLHGLRLLILNRGELETRVGRPLPDRAAIAQACRKLQVQGAQDVVVTLGDDGVLFTGIGGINRL